jgi:hypothetical protein
MVKLNARMPSGIIRFCKNFGLLIFYLAASLGFGAFAWYLQHKAFTPPPAAAQMYAAVFVRDPAAHVKLSAQIYPDDPSIDSVTLTVTNTSAGRAGWLLVVECPSNAPVQSHAIQLESETVPQTQAPATQVTVYSGTTGGPFTRFLGCIAAPGGPPGPLGSPGYSPSLADVSLTALQLDPEILTEQLAPTLYAEQARQGGTVGLLEEVFPTALCASPTSAPIQAIASASPGTSSATPASPPPSASSGQATSPVTTPSPQSSAAVSPTATATASPSPTESPSCSFVAPSSTKFIPYVLPTTVTTMETLNHVDTRGYQISMFPVGNTGEENSSVPGQATEETIMWQGHSGLNPSLEATNQAAESAASHDTFTAGVFFGLASGTAVALVEGLWRTFIDKKEERPSGPTRQSPETPETPLVR